jgi:hypothetical protein
LIVGVLALALLAGCGGKDEPKPGPTGTVKISTNIDLTVEDGSFNKSAVTGKPGTIKITVNVPADADGKHGVGIDGGQYDNIKGAPVAPGRSTSLTVSVKKGKYTIFDSYKDNRNKGYETALTIK